MITGLPPQEEISYFQAPVETVYNVGVTPVQIAKGDPMRVLLVMYATGQNVGSQAFVIPTAIALTNVTVATPSPRVNISTSANVTTSSGFSLSGLQSLLIVNIDWWGAACQVPWYAVATAANMISLTVMTLSLQRWPYKDGPQSQIQEADNGTFLPLHARQPKRNGRAKLYTDSWRKSKAISPYDLPYWGNGGIP